MRQAGLFRRLSYWFDNTMTYGTIALVGWLGLLSLVLIILFTLVLLAIAAAAGMQLPNGLDMNPINALWVTFLHAFNSGQLGNDQQVEWPFLATMFAVTIGGIFIVSSLIGVLTNGLNNRLVDLRRGRSQVLETGHTLILGWSEQIFTVVRQLAIANAARQHASIVIMGTQDKVEMEEALATKVGHTGKTRLICRSGNPIDPDDLRIVNPQAARSVIILPPADDEADSQVIKTVLALTNGGRGGKHKYHVVTQILDDENMEAAEAAGGPGVHFIQVGDTTARLVAQTCRQTGLSVVYSLLFDFSGDDIYFKSESALVGKTFGEALSSYEFCCVMGLRAPHGGVKLNPPMDTVITAEDRLVIIAADYTKAQLVSGVASQVDAGALIPLTPEVHAPERFLVLGWNRTAGETIGQLDSYVAPGSVVTVVADGPDLNADLVASQCGTLQNLGLSFQRGNTALRRTLTGLDPSSYQHLVVLSYSDPLDAHQADARTLITLLHLRDIKAKTKGSFSITSEMIDDRNRRLAEVAEVDDFIVSGKLFSMLMAQIAENRHRAPVYADLLSSEGSEIYLKPLELYVKSGRPVNFYTVVEAARRRGEVAIGYKRQADAYNAQRLYGVALNPSKSAQVTFDRLDRIIVLAES